VSYSFWADPTGLAHGLYVLFVVVGQGLILADSAMGWA
jgi:hypothetical protein